MERRCVHRCELSQLRSYYGKGTNYVVIMQSRNPYQEDGSQVLYWWSQALPQGNNAKKAAILLITAFLLNVVQLLETRQV